MGLPFLRHWYVGAGLPLAITVKVAVWPTFTDRFAGWVVMPGATSMGRSLKVRVLPAGERAWPLLSISTQPKSLAVVGCPLGMGSVFAGQVRVVGPAAVRVKVKTATAPEAAALLG